MEFYSHQNPKILLKNHLYDVAELSRNIVLSKKIDFIGKNIICDIAYLIGIAHDFGKYTTYFQDSRINKFQINNEKLGHHGLISAFFGLELIQEYLSLKKLTENIPYIFLPQISFFIIKHHHGDLDNIENDFDTEKLFTSGFKLISKQLEDIFNYKDIVTSEYDSLLNGLEISVSEIFFKMNKYEQRITYDDDISTLIRNSLRIPAMKMLKEKNLIFYLLFQFLYSVLIDSDKKNAGKVRKIVRRELPINLAENYLNKPDFQKNNESKINSIRNDIRKSVLRNINSKDKIFTLTAPTGTGKTLTSFSAALKLRKLIKEEYRLDNEPRIIYSLPFTSIIDQNFDVFDKVLQQIDDFGKCQSEYLLKHHYLVDVFYKTKNHEKEIEVGESLALIESWESEVIVTTFIQLFHTLIGYKNRMLKKFHNIVNSIVILDEVQNIPIKYWSLVHDILIGFTKYFNCRIILMTATKPLIFNQLNDEIKELLPEYENYYKSPELDRVKLNYSKSQTINEFYNNLPSFNLNSYLFVFNTIASSLEFFTKLTNNKNYKLFYLSTNIIPKERKNRITEIKTITDENKKSRSEKKFIVISTQLIEAGVDIDCEQVYRDLGPLDSVIQVAGRCNRNNFLDKKGRIDIVKFLDDKGKSYCSIYDTILNSITEKILQKKQNVSESQFITLIEEYFNSAKEKMYSDSELIESILNLNFDDDKIKKPISTFKLIDDEKYYKRDIFIEIDEEAEEVWKKFSDLTSIENPIDRKNQFLLIKKQLYEYVISVPKKCLPDGYNDGIYYLFKEQIKEFYNPITGFKLDKQLPQKTETGFY